MEKRNVIERIRDIYIAIYEDQLEAAEEDYAVSFQAEFAPDKTINCCHRFDSAVKCLRRIAEELCEDMGSKSDAEKRMQELGMTHEMLQYIGWTVNHDDPWVQTLKEIVAKGFRYSSVSLCNDLERKLKEIPLPEYSQSVMDWLFFEQDSNVVASIITIVPSSKLEPAHLVKYLSLYEQTVTELPKHLWTTSLAETYACLYNGRRLRNLPKAIRTDEFLSRMLKEHPMAISAIEKSKRTPELCESVMRKALQIVNEKSEFWFHVSIPDILDMIPDITQLSLNTKCELLRVFPRLLKRFCDSGDIAPDEQGAYSADAWKMVLAALGSDQEFAAQEALQYVPLQMVRLLIKHCPYLSESPEKGGAEA